MDKRADEQMDRQPPKSQDPAARAAKKKYYEADAYTEYEKHATKKTAYTL